MLRTAARLTDGRARLRKRTRELHVRGRAEPPVPSLLRGFSAPAKLGSDLSDDELNPSLRHDSDPFNRWQAAQTLAMKTLLETAAARRAGKTLEPPALSRPPSAG